MTAAAAEARTPAREHFEQAQARHRRASWLASGLAALAVVAAGLPLSALVTPLILAALLPPAFLLQRFGLAPPAAWEWLEAAAHLLPALWRQVRGIEPLSWDLVGILAAPGAVVMLVVWVGINILLRRGWSGAALRRLAARPSRRGDAAERRLENLVQELAVAAGVPPPQVAIMDTQAANALAVGLRMDDATVVASRGLLARLDRDQAQAVIAHLVASIGAGDLRIAARLLSVFQAWGFLALVADAPFSGPAREAIVDTCRTMWRATRGDWDQQAAEQSLDRLLAGAGQDQAGLYAFLDDVERSHSLRRNLLVDLPLILTGCIASLTIRTSIALFTVLIFGPAMAALWQSRRRLADASAVELTRHAEALRSGVERLNAGDVEVPGGEPISFLFPVWTKGAELREDRTDIVGHVLGLQLDPEARDANLRRLGALGQGEHAKPPPKPLRERVRELGKGLFWLVVALLLVGVLAIVSLVGMGVVLLALWAVLDALLFRLPNWVAGLF